MARCRRVFGQRRVGHGGTLDPPATGVLLVGLGQVTRLLRYVSAGPKSYEGELVLGRETTTLDDQGDTVAVHQMGHVTLEDVRAAAAGLVGEIEQVPPMVSAVKVGGRRLHELARAGVEVERAPRPVTVYRFDAEPAGPERLHGAGDTDPGVFRIAVECSSGTYVRVLAADVGHALGGGAHLRALRRTAVGSFSLAEALPLDDAGPEVVLPPADAVRDLPAVTVDDDIAGAVAHGAILDLAAAGLEGSGPWAVRGSGGNLLAVYEPHSGGRAKPSVVLAHH